jgi:hypothetical protein
LVRVGIQTVEFGDAVDFSEIDIEQVEGPVGSIADAFAVHE